MRFVFVFGLIGSVANADVENSLPAACAGWATDRLLLTVVNQKHLEMITALDAISTSNPSKPLADKVSDGLKQINEAVENAMEGTGSAAVEVCPNFPG